MHVSLNRPQVDSEILNRQITRALSRLLISNYITSWKNQSCMILVDGNMHRLTEQNRGAIEEHKQVLSSWSLLIPWTWNKEETQSTKSVFFKNIYVILGQYQLYFSMFYDSNMWYLQQKSLTNKFWSISKYIVI